MTDVPGIVLDASALLALLHGEPGGTEIEPLLSTAAISSVNWSEVLQKGLSRGVPVEGLRSDLESLGLAIWPFTAEDAEAAAGLWPQTRALGLSLGDRACLALAMRLDKPAFTTDSTWGQLHVGVEIMVLR